MEVSAFGVITNTSETLVRIAPTEFDQPVNRRTLLRLLDPDAAKRMCHLGLTCNRVISISREAFLKTVAAGRAPAFHAQSKML